MFLLTSRPSVVTIYVALKSNIAALASDLLTNYFDFFSRTFYVEQKSKKATLDKSLGHFV